METDTLNHYNCPGHGRHFKPLSIYDYPEHLNPFYEEDNHKRLRFWTINRKGKDGREKSSSTWSINSLRDLWAFKTFRMKKRSSTLGISKTSESPPPLRKEFYDNNYNSYDSRCRQTINGSTNEVAFERSTPYRASTGGLRSNKNYDTQSEILFNRNDTYRSTVQHVPSGQRYNHSSVTPVLKQKFGHGASQTSLRSTNPFEEDNDYEPVGAPLTPNSTLNSSTRSRYRKKRRAPPPPTSGKLMSNVREESSAPDNVELRIVEEPLNSTKTEPTTQELPSISSLTAEIETLVKSVEEDTDKLVKEVNAEKKSVPVNESEQIPTTVTEYKVIDTVVDAKSDKTVVAPIQTKINEDRIEVVTSSSAVVHYPPVERVVIQERNTDVKLETVPAPVSDVEIVTVTTITTTTPSVTEIITDERVVTSSGYDSDNDESEMSQTESMSKSSATVSNDLKIVEDDDTTSNESRSRGTVNSYEIKYRPLNDTGRTKAERAYEQRRREKERDAWRAELCRSNSSDGEVTIRGSSSVDHNGAEYHGERRRSVKEIIEAINKNQSLLQATNYSPLNGKYDYNEHPNLVAQRAAEAQALAATPESKLEVEVRNNERCYSYYDNVPDMLQNLDRQSQVFQKCGTPPKRTQSFEWNPLPKPARRSQNNSQASNLNNVD